MRTTVTLDPDVEQLLRDAMQRTRQSFKKTLNQAVRKGLAGSGEAPDEEPFEVVARPMKVHAAVDAARLNQLDDEVEVDAFLELTRTLSQRHGTQT